MSDCSWEEIHFFQSVGEYRRFVRWIEAQVMDGVCEELGGQEKPNSEWDDRWFRCNLTGVIWKLSCPDPGYFAGSWLPSDPDEPPHGISHYSV